jgi:hypothetical protein
MSAPFFSTDAMAKVQTAKTYRGMKTLSMILLMHSAIDLSSGHSVVDVGNVRGIKHILLFWVSNNIPPKLPGYPYTHQLQHLLLVDSLLLFYLPIFSLYFHLTEL